MELVLGSRLVNLIFLNACSSMHPKRDKQQPLSTNAVRASRYAPHGEFKLHVEGDIVFYDATGPFNLEALQALATVRSAILADWAVERPVAGIVHWHHSVMMSPEAFATYREGIARYHENAKLPVAIAWVASADVEGIYLMHEKFEKLFAERKTNFRLFDSLAPARAWVDGHLAAAHTP